MAAVGERGGIKIGDSVAKRVPPIPASAPPPVPPKPAKFYKERLGSIDPSEEKPKTAFGLNGESESEKKSARKADPLRPWAGDRIVFNQRPAQVESTNGQITVEKASENESRHPEPPPTATAAEGTGPVFTTHGEDDTPSGGIVLDHNNNSKNHSNPVQTKWRTKWQGDAETRGHLDRERRARECAVLGVEAEAIEARLRQVSLRRRQAEARRERLRAELGKATGRR